MKSRQPISIDRDRSVLFQSGFTILEVMIVTGVIAILIALLMPAMRTSGEAARRMSCSNNFKQIGLAVHNYHAAFKRMPMAMGTSEFKGAVGANENRLSGLVALAPFVEASSMWETISNPASFNGIGYPEMGPEPKDANYDPWSKQTYWSVCPSYDRPSSHSLGVTSYAFCVGDVVDQLDGPERPRGMSAARTVTKFRMVADGISNTILMTEIRNGLSGRNANAVVAIVSDDDWREDVSSHKSQLVQESRSFSTSVAMDEWGRGAAWADGTPGVAMVNTILPPGGANILNAKRNTGFLSAGSFHMGGCHVLMGDGAVKFVTDSIDCGERDAIPLRSSDLNGADVVGSRHGLWGALGSAAGQEDLLEEF